MVGAARAGVEGFAPAKSYVNGAFLYGQRRPPDAVSSLSATRPYDASRHLTYHRVTNTLTCGDAVQRKVSC